jgi:hypothetical protein
MRDSTVFERINIALNRRDWDTLCCGSFDQQVNIVATLSSRDNLFSADKQIVRVRQLGVLRVWHGVEGANRQRILIHHVEIHTILLLDNGTKALLVRSTNVFIWRGIHTIGLAKIKTKRGHGRGR